MTRLFFFCVFALFVIRGLGHSWGPFQTYVHLSEKNDGVFTASIPLHVDTFVGPVSFSMVCPIPTQVCITHEMSVSQTREYLEKDCVTGSFMQFKAGGNSTDPFRIHPLAPVNYPETYVHADSALGSRKFSRKEDAGIHRQMNTAYLREGNNFITVATKKKGEHIAGNYTNCVLQWYGHQCNAGIPVHSDCAPLEEVHVNRSYHSRLPPDSWTFYLLEFDLDRRVKELEIRVNGTEADDVAVYMRLGGAPVVDGSTVIADAYADKSTNNMLVASVLEPSQGRWIVGFHNKNTRKVHTVNFQLTAYKCGNTSVIGLHCNRNITDLSNTRHASEHEFDSDDDWNYFVIRQRRSIKVGVAPANTGDDVPELYVNIENPPNNQGLVVKGHKDVNFASLSTTVGPTKKRPNRALAHFVSHAAHHDDDDGVNWYIGVKGSGKYYIWANSYCADNCNGHGTCNTHTGICDCDSGYEGFDCVKDSSSSGFKPVYIILIVIGGLIVLAVAIGVPLAFWLRNRHRQSYEKL